jgi:hypothetical protein
MVPVSELEVAVMKFCDLDLELLGLCLKTGSLLGQFFNSALLLIRPAQRLMTEGLFDQFKESLRPTPVASIHELGIEPTFNAEMQRASKVG